MSDLTKTPGDEAHPRDEKELAFWWAVYRAELQTIGYYAFVSRETDESKTARAAIEKYDDKPDSVYTHASVPHAQLAIDRVCAEMADLALARRRMQP